LKKIKRNFGFIAFAAIIVFSMVTCKDDGGKESVLYNYLETYGRKELLVIYETFPSELIGTWKRADQAEYTNTLTFTSNTLMDSNQFCHWNLICVSGDAYTIAWNDQPNWKFTDVFKFTAGNLEISNDTGTGQDNWNGTWIKQ